VLGRNSHPRLNVMTPQLKRFGYFAIGILVGLSSAGVAYHVVPLIGVAVSSAETVDDLQVEWLLGRIWMALKVARVSSTWAYGLLLRR